MGDDENTAHSRYDYLMGAFGAVDDGSDDGLTPEDSHRDSAQPVEPPSSLLPGPTNDPKVIIANGREKLINEIDADKDDCWADGKQWDQLKKCAQYRETIRELLNLEKQHAHTLFTPLLQASPRQHPANLLQYVLEKAHDLTTLRQWGPKIKFLLRVIADVDPNQLTPKGGNKPLHAAADVDIRVKAIRPSDSDLTIYVCDLMPDAKAAAALAETNDNKENIIHRAVYHNLEGIKTLIHKASEAAFRAQRDSRGDGQKALPNDGNTPLHDAVDFDQHFLMPGPECKISAVAGKRSSDAKDTTSRSAAYPRANESRARSGQAAEPPEGVCSVCENANQRKNKAWKARREIIVQLLKRYDKALMIHNSAGLSPYLYLLTESQKPLAGQPKETAEAAAAAAVGEQQQQPAMGLNRQTTLDGASVSGGDAAEERDLEKSEQELKLQEQKKLLLKQAKPTRGHPGGQDDGLTHTREGRNAAGVKVPVKNTPPKNRTHNEHDLKKADIGSNSILNGLMVNSFWLGGYEEACKCLFPGQGSESSLRGREPGRQRRFSIEAPKRVQDDTKNNYNFLRFEPMMADVDLNLEYSQEETRSLSNNEKEKLDMWRQDEENLVEFFRWLSKDKGVTSILRLTVRDNPDHYCSDHTIKKCLEYFEIRYLNWVRPNLWASSHALPSSLIDLSLYWSGLNSVLWGWSAAEGLQTLEELKVIRLFVQRGPDDESEQNEKTGDFKSRVEKWKRRSNLQSPRVVIADDETQLRRGGKGNEPGAHFKFPKHPWIITAGKFGDELATMYMGRESIKKADHYIKVALLDDGVDPTYDQIGVNLHYAGWTPTNSGGAGGGAQSFYASTHQHGTKMAWLIRRVCPFVTVYVAKLSVTGGEDLQRRSFGLVEATRAIEWAIEQGVDIISMSWNAREVSGANSNRGDILGLEAAIDKAAGEGILMFGAACDLKGSPESEKWVPCDHGKVWSIGATDRDFDPKKYLHMNKVDFLFPGESVLNSRLIDDIEVGNSGATALASGLAAVILFCMKVGCKPIPNKVDRREWMGKVMTYVFQSNLHGKSVRVDGVLRLDRENGLLDLANKFVSHK